MTGPSWPLSATASTDVTWATVSRALRAALGFAQEDLAASLLVSRKSIQRWERGLGAPDDQAERLLLELLRERRVFERRAVEIGVTSPEDLSDVLSRSRRGRAPRASAESADVATAGLVGRGAELAELHRLLGQERLVTVTGSGGVGKTALATVALRTAAINGRVMVDLVEVRDSSLVLAAIAEQLNVDEHGGRTVRDTVVRSIGHDRLLMFLDNLEHLPAAAPIIEDLLASCSGLQLLVTSRVPLRLASEHEFRLDPLDTGGQSSAATELFVSFVRQWDRVTEFSSDELTTISDLCARLDGLPLAIELAAARVRAVSLTDLHQRIDKALRVLGRGPRDRPVHQQTLRDSIQWSCDLLTPDQRDLLVRLGYFVGGCTMATAEAVGSAAAFDDVVTLVESGLLFRRENRYRTLETVREFVSEMRNDESDGCFVEWAASIAEQYSNNLRGPDQRAALDVLAVEYPNLRAALQQLLAAGDGRKAHRLAIALCGYWDGRSLLSEARRWLELTLAAPGADAIQSAVVHTWLGYFSAHQNEMSSAAAHANTALAIWTETGIDAGKGYALLILGRVAAEAGRYDNAESLLSDSVRMLRAAGDDWGLIRPLNALGECAQALGRFDEALLLHQEALSMCVALDERGSQPSILCDIAHVSLELGDIAAAGKAADEALAISSQLGNQVGVANALNALAAYQLAIGDAALAVELWAESEVLHAELGLPVEHRVARTLARDKAAARVALGDDEFHKHREIGEARAPGTSVG